MNARTFEQAFNAVFHDKQKFDEFCNPNIESEIDVFEINGREIFRTSDKLKKFLQFLNKVILRNLAKDYSVVHAFVEGRSTLTAVQAHIGSTYFFLTDIRNFYPNISTDDVRKVFVRDKNLIPISDFENYIDLVTSYTTLRGTLPIGFATSPQLSNAFLFEFDSEVSALCAPNGLKYTRYADDIIISGQSFEALSNLREEVQEVLNLKASSNLKLSKSKTHITQLGNKVKILGLVILPNGKITIDVKYKNLIESLLYFYVNDKDRFSNLLSKSLHGNYKSLFGLLHYSKSIDPAYLEKLQKKYGVYSIRSLMEQSQDD